LDTTVTDVAMPEVTYAARFLKNGGASQPTMTNAGSNIYELNMSRLRAIVCESHMQNTARFTNQTFQLIFNVERQLDYAPDINIADLSKCTLHMAYLYNAVILIGGDGGTSKLVTN